MSLKEIDKNIRLVVTSGDKLNKLIHDTAMLIANHAKEHGDCTRALSLVKAMPASMRRTMLVLWFTTYTPIRVVEKNDKVGMLKPEAKGYTPFDLEAGALVPFYTLAEQNPEGKVLDFDKLMALVAGLAKRIEKQNDEGKIVPEDVPSALALARALSGLKVERVQPSNDSEDKPVNDEEVLDVALKAVA